MQKKIVSLILFVVLLGLVGYFIYSTLGLKADKQALEPIAISTLKEDARIVKEAGEVTIERGNANIMVSAEEKLEVSDVVTLQGETTAVFYWPDGSISRATGPAEIVVEAMMFDNSTGDTNTEMQIKSGEVWTKVMGMVTEGSTTTVRAGDTVAGIRGTQLIHNVTDTGVTIGVLEHGVEVTRRGVSTPVLQYQELVARNAAAQVDLRIVDTSTYQEKEESWETLVAAHSTSLNEKRIALLGTPTRNLNQIVKDTDTLLSRTDRTEVENMKIHRNIQELVAGWSQASINKDTDGMQQHLAALEKTIGQAREAFASNAPHLNQLLGELTMYNKIVITDKPRDGELLPFRQLMQKEKSFIYQDMGRTADLERLLLRELFFVQDLSLNSFDQADIVMNSIENSETLLKPLQNIDTSENAAMIRGLLDALEKEKVTTSERIEAIRVKLFPDATAQSTSVNQNTNSAITTEVLPPRVPEENLKTPTQKVTPVKTTTTNTAKTNAAVAPTASDAAIAPKTTTSDVAPTPVAPITAPNRTVEPTPVKVEPAPARGTITNSR